ncbi:hypothetical protein D3C80_1866960 [compost metagenome]
MGSAATCSSSSALGTTPKSTLPSSMAWPPSRVRPSHTVRVMLGNFSAAREMISGSSNAEAVAGMETDTCPLGSPRVEVSSSFTESSFCTTERATS